jgi:hypothetical protein
MAPIKPKYPSIHFEEEAEYLIAKRKALIAAVRPQIFDHKHSCQEILFFLYFGFRASWIKL